MLVASTTMLLFAGGCGDDATNPAGEAQYKIFAYLLEDLSTINVRIIRLDSRDADPMTTMITADGQPMQLDPKSSAAEAIFEANVPPMLGQSHSVVMALAGNHATATLAAPSQPSELAVTYPPEDSLFYDPGSPLRLEWHYEGDAPGEFNLVVVVLRGTHPPIIHSETLGPDSRSTLIPGSITSLWSAGQQALVNLEAQRRDSIAGDLAAEGSIATVLFATSQITLQKR